MPGIEFAVLAGYNPKPREGLTDSSLPGLGRPASGPWTTMCNYQALYDGYKALGMSDGEAGSHAAGKQNELLNAAAIRQHFMDASASEGQINVFLSAWTASLTANCPSNPIPMTFTDSPDPGLVVPPATQNQPESRPTTDGWKAWGLIGAVAALWWVTRDLGE